MFEKWLRNHNPADFPLEQRLFEKASNRAYWNCFLGESQIQKAETYCNYQWPMIRATHYMAYQKTGNRIIQEDPHFARRRALIALFLGELAEYQGRFLPDLCDGIFAICEETFWGLSAHYPITRENDLLPSASDPYIDLFAAETGELLSVIYHILYEELYTFCPQILERLEYELERRILTPYCNRGDFIWMGSIPWKPDNWTPWILQNVLTVFVTLPVSHTRRAFALSKMLVEMERYYITLPTDGGCEEGPLYWSKAGGKLFAFCDLLYITSGGRINFFQEEALKQMGLFEAKAYIGKARFVNFADGASLILHFNMDYPLYGYGLRIGEENMCRFAATFKKDQAAVRKSLGEDDNFSDTTGIKDILFSRIYAAQIDSQPPFEPYKVSIYPQLQTAYLRENSWYAAIKGGYNDEQHNHNDVGNFIVYYDQEPVLVDPGIGTYTKQTFSEGRYALPGTQSAYHNLPLINGVMQKEGLQFRADRFEAEGQTVTVSFAGAYPEEANVSQILRTLQLHAEGVDISDTFTFPDTGAVIEHFMTPLPVTVCADTAYIGDRFVLQVTNSTATVDRLEFAGDRVYLGAWNCDGLNRIRFTLSDSQTQITLRRLP